jgi:hypothetical protein
MTRILAEAAKLPTVEEYDAYLEEVITFLELKGLRTVG